MKTNSTIFRHHEKPLSRQAPRNGNKLGVDAGCQVQIPIASMDIVNRTFDYTSTGDCLGNATGFTF